MRKTELVNCPQWLLNATTENEDVDFDQYGILVWNGGDFLGGNFRGGDFLGGNFLGGNFRGGDFLGGNFWGGDFLGGNFRGGNFLGEKISRAPISIYGLKNWYVQITPRKMHIGCQHHTHAKWKNFTAKEIAKMHIDATEFWRVNSKFLLSICDYEASI
ncbi:MAG: hypothetical protein Q8924_12280 [Bacillota bacterium]|nr:hypothetical protein [Bacillota bacterium]